MGDAFVAIEDERFYKHNGIDLQGIIRAGVVGVTHGFHFTEGASTLTQQLIKNNVFPNFVNETNSERFERKIQEQYLALKIEKQMSKKEILEAYMRDVLVFRLPQSVISIKMLQILLFQNVPLLQELPRVHPGMIRSSTRMSMPDVVKKY